MNHILKIKNGFFCIIKIYANCVYDYGKKKAMYRLCLAYFYGKFVSA